GKNEDRQLAKASATERAEKQHRRRVFDAEDRVRKNSRQRHGHERTHQETEPGHHSLLVEDEVDGETPAPRPAVLVHRVEVVDDRELEEDRQDGKRRDATRGGRLALVELDGGSLSGAQRKTNRV